MQPTHGDFRQWASQVLSTGYRPRHDYHPVGVLPPFVLDDPGVVELAPHGPDVHISDAQLLHAQRLHKQLRGSAVRVDTIFSLPASLTLARWVFDESHRGVIAFFDTGDPGRVAKAVVHLRHVRKGVRYNAVLTLGLVQPENENARVYRALKAKA